MHVSYLTIGLLFRIPQSTLLCFLSHIDMHQAIRRLKVFVGGDSLVAVDLILGKFHVTFHRVQSLDLLCILYFYNLPNVSSLTQTPLFVDDTSIFCSRDPNRLISIVNHELSKVVALLKAKQLSLNWTKTNFVIFHPREKNVNVNVPHVLDNTVIKEVVDIKFLVVIINQYLSWKSKY